MAWYPTQFGYIINNLALFLLSIEGVCRQETNTITLCVVNLSFYFFYSIYSALSLTIQAASAKSDNVNETTMINGKEASIFPSASSPLFLFPTPSLSIMLYVYSVVVL